MTEIKSVIPKLISLNTKIKALLIVCTLFLSGVGLYHISESSSNSISSNDPFVTDIQHRSDLVSNIVSETIDHQGDYGTIAYKQKCEDSLAYVQKEQLNTNYNYNSLSEKHKVLVQKYRNYLKESANVIIACSNNQKPDLSKMISDKKELN